MKPEQRFFWGVSFRTLYNKYQTKAHVSACNLDHLKWQTYLNVIHETHTHIRPARRATPNDSKKIPVDYKFNPLDNADKHIFSETNSSRHTIALNDKQCHNIVTPIRDLFRFCT